MATLVRLQLRLPGFKGEFFQRNRCVDEYRKIEYYAAVKIQSWFRGCKVRAYIRRGLEEFAEMKEREEEKQALEREEKKKNYQARKMHYLLSTQQIAGIYNSPYLKLPDPMELQLKKAKPLTHKAQPREKDGVDPYQLSCTDSSTSQPVPLLPPIGRKKPQGPFRDTVEVLQQRLKPFEPSMRVAASNTSLEEAREKIKQEEWRNRVHDDEFLPFASYHKPYKYIPSMQSSKYDKESYGLKSFREQHREKWITNKDFITAIPPIHLFEKFGKTYSRAGEIV